MDRSSKPRDSRPWLLLIAVVAFCAGIYLWGTAFVAVIGWAEDSIDSLGSPSTALPVAAEEDEIREDCDEIGSTAFRSAEEKLWFEDNCEPTPTPTAEATPTATIEAPPGERRDCSAMRGTPYRSAAEREFFLANCLTPTASR